MTDYQAVSTSSTPSGLARPALVLSAFAALIAIALWPLMLVEIPPLMDYPNHLARMHILATIDGDPELQSNYAVDWALVPNLAMDALVPIMSGVFGLFTAAKMFVAICMALPVIGAAVLHRTIHGSWSLWPITALFFVYGQTLIWGFLNYLFTIGLYFLVFAAWIATDRWPRGVRLALFSLLATTLYLGHFFAFCVYGLSIVAYELWKALEARKTAASAIKASILWPWVWSQFQFLIPGALLLMAPNWNGEKVTDFGSLGAKISALLSPVLAYGQGDGETFIVLVIVGVIAFRAGWLRLNPALRFPLVFLTVAAVLMPHVLLSNWFTDYRLPTVLAMLLVAASQFNPPSRRVAWVLAVIALALFAGRLIPIAMKWNAYDRNFAEFRLAAQSIERGARVLSVQVPFQIAVQSQPDLAAPRTYWHLASLAVIDRSVFTPMLFTNRAAQPVQASETMAHLDVPYGRPVWPKALRIAADPGRKDELAAQRRHGDARIYWEDWPEHYDYVLFLRWNMTENPAPAFLTLVERGSYFDIYKVVKDDGSVSPAP